jgi:hypothetical protein
MEQEKKTFVYFTLDHYETTVKALTEYQQRAQEQMKQVPEFGDEWAHWHDEVVKSNNALMVFQAMETRRLGAWMLTFEPGKEGIDHAHKTMTGQPLYDPMETVYRNELLGLSREEWDN